MDKRCNTCGKVKPLTDFYRSPGMRDGHRNDCKACNLAAKAARHRADPEPARQRAKQWRLDNPDRSAAQREQIRVSGSKKRSDRRSHLKRKFGLTVEQYEEMLAAQDGRCAICRREPRPDIALHVDHHHDTGEVRGLLCFDCNAGIGKFRDDRPSSRQPSPTSAASLRGRMAFPFFPPDDDPGPNFAELLRRAGLVPGVPAGKLEGVTHGTTVLAIRYADGVVMAGDRRATSGNLISHRTMEKVYPADRHSGVAIAGAAGPAMEMVKLFQLQLEHYEKVEGSQLSLEGKANQLSQMVRGHLPAAMQGMAVVPLFAGYDVRRRAGRLFQYDVTGGRYEEADFAATGSGSLHAGTVVKLGYHPGMTREETLDLAIRALFQAADEDSATGGPDLVRGIYPTMATITADGFTNVEEPEIAERFRGLLEQLATPESTATSGPAPTMGGTSR